MTPEGWPRGTRLVLGLSSGLATTAAFPPLDQRWVALIALVPLLLALRGARARDGALIGAAWGIGFFAVLLFWISTFGFAAWVALTLLMTAFTVAFAALSARVSRSAAGRLAGIPALWATFEMLRGRIPFGGFIWGALGSSQHSGGPMLHLARLGGVFALSFVLVAVDALIAEAIVARTIVRRATLGLGVSVLVLAPALLPLGLAGAARGTIDIAAVQGNVPRDRFTGLGRRGRLGPEDFTIVRNHIDATRRLEGSARPDLIVWAENSFDRDPRTNPDMFRPVVDELRKIGAPLLAGAVLDEGERWTNTNLLIAPDGTILDRYDKVHLVPFGEYVPLPFVRHLVPALNAELAVDGIAGHRLVVFDIGGKPVGSLICFESTYPELARGLVRRGAQVIVVTTNDASFGTSPAARQHLAMSQMRAVEEGRAVVQTAISGISAIISADGHISQATRIFTPGVLRASVPLASARTPYAAIGGLIESLLVAIAAAFAITGLRRGRGV